MWPLREGQASLWKKILLNLAENTDLYLWEENSAIHYVRYNVITVIARRIVLVCKAVVQRPIIERHSIPDFSNELGKQSFQNEFLNQCVEAEERRGRKEINKKRGPRLGAFGPRHPGFNQALGKGSEDVMKMRRWPLFGVCHGIDFPDTMLQCMTDQSN